MLFCWNLLAFPEELLPLLWGRLSTILRIIVCPLLSQLLLKLQQHYHYLVEQIKDLESPVETKVDEDEVGQRLLSIPCVGTLDSEYYFV